MTYTELQHPLYGTVDGEPIIAVGAIMDMGAPTYVVIGADGRMSFVPLERMKVDVRYDRGARAWEDISPRPAEEDEDE